MAKLLGGTTIGTVSPLNATSNSTGSLQVVGGVGITGSLYTGNLFITGASTATGNGINFTDGTTQRTAGSPANFSQASFNTANSALNSATAGYTHANAAYNTANTATTTITDDTSTAVTQYPLMARVTSGILSTSYVDSTGLTFNPGTGTLTSVVFTSTSDENRKDNIVTIKNAVDTVQKLRGVEYTWKDNGEKGMGVVAQELEKVLPELVHTNENGDKTVAYPNMIGLLIEAIKELKAEIDKLKGDNK